MVALIVAAMITAGTPEVSVDAERAEDATAQAILALNPRVGEKQARRLGKLIDYWSDHYDVDPELMVALIRIESNFQSGLKACWPAPWKGEGQTTCDHGLAQINQTWIDKWMLDPEKLVKDDSYNIYVQARILAWIKRYYGHEQNWYGRYHSATPSKKALYVNRLEGFLAQL
jgi:hypothetical protein